MENQQSKVNARPALSKEEANQNPPARRKQAYEKPTFLYRAPLEAMAAVCLGPGGKGPGVCGTLFS
jgi:hypothetical protein